MQFINIFQTVIETTHIAGPSGIEISETAITTEEVTIVELDLVDVLLLLAPLSVEDIVLLLELIELEELLDAMDEVTSGGLMLV